MTDSLHSVHTLFIDRNSGGKLFRDIVAAAGISIVLHDEHFGTARLGERPPDDHDWLVQIGKQGWLIVTGDTRMIREPLFLRELPRSDAYVFLLHDLNGKTPQGKAECIIDAFPKMIGLIEDADRPAVWLFKSGKVTAVNWLERLKKYSAWGRIPTD